MFIIDVETTGLDPLKHSVVSIGIVDFLRPRERHFYINCRMWDGAEIDLESLRVNGFTPEQVRERNRYSLSEAVDKALSYIKGCRVLIPAGMNVARFDIPMMIEACRKVERKWPYEKYSVDLHTSAYASMFQQGVEIPKDVKQRSALNTSAIFAYVGLPPEPRPHHALTGAKMEAEAFSRIIERKTLFSEYEKYPLPEYLRR